ncbi:hypothetical protein SAY86_008554 [Trapa natans]|uniref:Uncharacterized protein n=1 Tax=Trapa natans TaxID=22666 RepID=A0AAN7KEY7_TRANT|nr:hypothetical protein SAY86_008554 [Trapa natans]
MNPDAPMAPRLSPTIRPLELCIRLSWLSAGWRMLKRTHAIAGMIGSRRARPLLSPASASSAICCAASAGSEVARVEKTAPAMAEAEMDSAAGLLASDRAMRPFGMGRRGADFAPGFDGLELLRHLTL